MPCCSYAFPSKLFSFKIKQIREHEQLSAHLSANSIGKGEGKIETEPIQASKQPASSASQLMKIPGGIDGRNLASAPSPLPSIPSFSPSRDFADKTEWRGEKKNRNWPRTDIGKRKPRWTGAGGVNSSKPQAGLMS